MLGSSRCEWAGVKSPAGAVPDGAWPSRWRRARHGGAHSAMAVWARTGSVTTVLLSAGSDEGLDGEVVDGAGVAAAGLVDQHGSVVGE